MASSNKKQDLQKAHIFSNIFRFMDDLQTFNNNEFENRYLEIENRKLDIYLEGLELKKENLSIEVHDRCFTIKFTDKRDTFPLPKYTI